MKCDLVFVTDGDTLWLDCFIGNPDAERGEIVTLVEPGTKWDDLILEVTEHQSRHDL